VFLAVDETVSLRSLAPHDADNFYLLIEQSRDYIQEWLPWLQQIQSPNDSLHFILNEQDELKKKERIILGIFIQETCSGLLGFHQIDQVNKIGYLGYLMGEAYTGRGIVTAALRTLIKYAFEDLSLNRIDMRIASENNASIKVAKRLHFKKEGRLRQAEWLRTHYVDHLVFSMLKSDWKIER